MGRGHCPSRSASAQNPSITGGGAFPKDKVLPLTRLGPPGRGQAPGPPASLPCVLSAHPGGEGFPNLPTKVMLVGPGGEAENRLGGRQGFHMCELSWAVKAPLPGTSSPSIPPAPWKLLWF